jgi:hypothetical protein
VCSAWFERNPKAFAERYSIAGSRNLHDNTLPSAARWFQHIGNQPAEAVRSSYGTSRHAIKAFSGSSRRMSNSKSSWFQNGQSSASANESKASEDYEIDPISNRKVFKSKSQAATASKPATNPIPVKTFKGYRSQFSQFTPPQVSQSIEEKTTSPSAPAIENATATDSVLSDSEMYLDGRSLEEELGIYEPYRHNEPDGQPPLEADPVEEALKHFEERFPHAHASEIEEGTPAAENTKFANNGAPATKGQTAPLKSQQRSSKFSILDAEKDEDLDLLRSSDVRAASGILKRPKKEKQEEKQAIRQKLEESFQEVQKSDSGYPEHVLNPAKAEEIRRRAQNFEIERSLLLNHHAHLRSRIDADLAELDSELSQVTALPSGEEKDTPTPKPLTGNFVRDFPEEFATAWKTMDSQKTLIPKNSENKPKPSSSSKPALVFSRNPNTPRIQTSLERQETQPRNKLKVEKDPYTKEPKGLEVSYIKECADQGEPEPAIYVSSYGSPPAENDRATDSLLNTKKIGAEKNKDFINLAREVRSIYEDAYGPIQAGIAQSPVNDSSKVSSAQAEPLKATASSAPNPGTPAQPVTPAEPILYKILAYDPTMQTINTAETTSIVTDTSAALTPAEVLLRLSNPSKFFPHFQPLQAEGYEIASGSGDVLVFRKVRDGPSIDPVAPAKEIPAEPVSRPARRFTNPIDGMQTIRPATGNFASPTGFVNHNFPEEDIEEFPRFNSHIDVRREEDVFTGGHGAWKGKTRSEKKKMSTGKKLLFGAAWVAAASYSVGVVTEYFVTGGADGLGADRI